MNGQLSNRHLIVPVLLLMFLAVACGGDAAQPAADDTGSAAVSEPRSGTGGTLRIAYAVTAEPTIVAKSLGLAEKYTSDIGAEAEWIPFQSGRDEINALVAGDVDVIMVSGVPAASAVAAELPVKIIWQMGDISNSEGLVVRNEAGINDVPELAGHSVGVVFNSSSHYLIESIVDHFEIADDVDLVNLDPPGLIAAWQQGSIDGGVIWSPPLLELIDSDGNYLLPGGDFRDLTDGAYAMPSFIVASDDALNEKRHLLVAYLKALDEAGKRILSDANEAAEAAADEYGAEDPAELARLLETETVIPTASEQLQSEWMGTSEDLGNTFDATLGILEFMAESGAVEGSADETALAEAFDVSLIEEVAAQCGPDLSNYDC